MIGGLISLAGVFVSFFLQSRSQSKERYKLYSQFYKIAVKNLSILNTELYKTYAKEGYVSYRYIQDGELIVHKALQNWDGLVYIRDEVLQNIIMDYFLTIQHDYCILKFIQQELYQINNDINVGKIQISNESKNQIDQRKSHISSLILQIQNNDANINTVLKKI
jgi:hypothetical protein